MFENLSLGTRLIFIFIFVPGMLVFMLLILPSVGLLPAAIYMVIMGAIILSVIALISKRI